jgi:hypothetical protein
MNFSARHQIASRAQVIYTGDSRPLKADDHAFMQFYLRTLHPRLDPTMYRRELRLLENGSEHWVPVQEPLRENFTEELAPGDTVVVFVLYHGAYTTAADTTTPRLMLGITEFESRRADRQWFRRLCPR